MDYQTRAFSYIGNVAPYIANSVNLADAYNQVFNIGADKEYTVNELAESVMKSMQIKGALRYVEARNEAVHVYASHQKAKRTFNLTNFTSLNEGLEKMAEWAKKTGIKKSKKFEGIEITEKLPPLWLENIE